MQLDLSPHDRVHRSGGSRVPENDRSIVHDQSQADASM